MSAKGQKSTNGRQIAERRRDAKSERSKGKSKEQEAQMNTSRTLMVLLMLVAATWPARRATSPKQSGSTRTMASSGPVK